MIPRILDAWRIMNMAIAESIARDCIGRAHVSDLAAAKIAWLNIADRGAYTEAHYENKDGDERPYLDAYGGDGSTRTAWRIYIYATSIA